MASIKCAHCKGTHKSVQEVRLCATKDVPAERLFAPIKVSGPGVPPGTVINPAFNRFEHGSAENHWDAVKIGPDLVTGELKITGPSGEAFLQDWWCGHRDKAGELCDQPVEKTAGGDPVHEDRLLDLEHAALAFSWGQIERARAGKSVDVQQVQRTQDRAKALTSGPVTEGYYKVGDTIYKVQRAVHGSGNLYAKELVTEELAVSELNEAQIAAMHENPDKKFYSGSWEYAPGAIRRIRGEHKLSMEECIAFGQLYGVCVRCGRTLTKEESIARGMGDVCAGKGLVL